MRRSYELGGLDEGDLAPTWLEQFERWLADAASGGVGEPSAMVLSTVGDDGAPDARFVLLKGLGADGLRFFGGAGSAKGRALAATPRAAIVFPWHDLQRQVRLAGPVHRLPDADIEAYFSSRPWGSQISALASPQSEVVASRAVLEAARDELARRHPEGGPVPRPEGWVGWRLEPESVEFWQGRRDRLHDRLVYRLGGDGAWAVRRLAP
ncbi:pyridoxamine 5'-phosphate oxidase [Baekduia soli]|uniref:Pyridoxine/pyridoxamine 5'-phosphate oxidase n=2 Tax=Baekduia soli TaxID=496014 RepID=A0A5B8UCN3_9ACTN|nr:pyridoxamine 5'-phosphate oxidase [Baekduia soli]